MKSFLKYILLGLVAIVLLISGFCLGKNRTEKRFAEIRAEQSMRDMEINKKQLLNSKNLTLATFGAALDFIPSDNIMIDFGYKDYTIDSFAIPLNRQEHQKFINMLPLNETYGSSRSIVPPNMPVWTVDFRDDVFLTLQKKGFICELNYEYRTNICGIGYSECPKPVFIGLTCSYVGDQKKNTLEYVGDFMKAELKSAGIDCGESCLVEKRDYAVISIPYYSRDVIYFEKLLTNTDSNKASELIRTEGEKSTHYFQLAGWSAKLEDISETEKGMDKGAIASYQVTATSNFFECTHTITIRDNNLYGSDNDKQEQQKKGEKQNLEKREMIKCALQLSSIKE